MTFSPPRKEMTCNGRVADRWAWKSASNNDYLNYEIIKEEQISTPSGQSDMIVLRTTGFMNGDEIKESITWFADKVGNVKEMVDAGRMNMIRELSCYTVK